MTKVRKVQIVPHWLGKLEWNQENGTRNIRDKTIWWKITPERKRKIKSVFCAISSLFSHHHTAKAIWCLSVCLVVFLFVFCIVCCRNFNKCKTSLKMIKWLNSNQQTTEPVYPNCLAQQLKRVCKTETDCLLHIKCVFERFVVRFFFYTFLVVFCLFWFGLVGFHCCCHFVCLYLGFSL